MDRKSIIVLVVSFLFILSWPMLVNKVWPPVPAPARTNQVATATGTNQLPSATNGAQPSAQPVVPPAALPGAVETAPLVRSGASEETVVIENERARYIISSHGGGIKQVDLLNYPAAVTCEADKKAATNRVRLNNAAPIPSLAILGGDAVQGDGLFKVSRTDTGARAEKVLTNGLRLVKNYQLSSNYLINVSVRLENQGSQALTLPAQEWVVGTVSSLWAGDDPTRMGVDWYNGRSKETVNQSWFDNKTLGCFPGTPRSVYLDGSNNVAWGAVHSQFFTLVVMPKEPAPQMRVVPASLPASRPQAAPNPALQAGFLYPAMSLAPGKPVEREFTIYAGPKEYQRLVRLGNQYNNNLDLIMDFDGFFGWFAQVLLSSMNGLNKFGLGYALAIIAITIIIKLLFWPLTNASTKSMKRMAALQPQMRALQEKYKDDPAKMNRKLMEFMKEHKVSPLGGCLPMLLQIPVFFGFFTMIQSAIELRGASFLWVCDLSRPDTLFMIPGLEFPFNPLPLIMGVTMLWQAQLTPPSPGMDPMQQKLMRYMPLMFLFLLYNFSAGLTLYWTVQNLLTIAQMKLTRTKEEPPASAAAPAPVHGPRRKK